jgi:hypothetical protein
VTDGCLATTAATARGVWTENLALTGSERPRKSTARVRADADVVNPRRVFVIGPVTGATVAAAYYKVINAMQDKEAENEPAADRADTDVKPVEA